MRLIMLFIIIVFCFINFMFGISFFNYKLEYLRLYLGVFFVFQLIRCIDIMM